MNMLNTCRFCGESGSLAKGDLIQYSTRHYAHAICGLQTKGSEFFNMLEKRSHTLIEKFPYMIAVKLGFGTELRNRIEGVRK